MSSNLQPATSCCCRVARCRAGSGVEGEGGVVLGVAWARALAWRSDLPAPDPIRRPDRPRQATDGYSELLNNRRFGVPLTLPVITFAVELFLIQLSMVEDEALPFVAL